MVSDGRVTSVGLRLPEEDEPPQTPWGRIKRLARRLASRFG
jgi:hypothetical protein